MLKCEFQSRSRSNEFSMRHPKIMRVDYTTDLLKTKVFATHILRSKYMIVRDIEKMS